MTIRSIPVSEAPRTCRTPREGWFAWLSRVLQAIESRRHLAEMDRRMLADIGISRSDAREEAARAPWDLAPRRR
jgi:uncharacterized protein YjiS (DUF1127 family)